MRRDRLLCQRRLTQYLDMLGSTVGYGCTTCIGNGPLREDRQRSHGERFGGASVLSGNRNFNPHSPTGAGQLPGLAATGDCVRVAGTVDIDLTRDPLGMMGTKTGLLQRYLAQRAENPGRRRSSSRRRCSQRCGRVPETISGGLRSRLASLRVAGSTYIQEPPFFDFAPAAARGRWSGRCLSCSATA